MFSTQYANINLLWGALLIEELSRAGVTDICIAPGSRSTPLTLAAIGHTSITTHRHFDERGLGYFALGLSRAKNAPVVIVTTSGSAVANLYPAVVEARLTRVPLIVLSADRPDELLDCGANQAINQRGIFAATPVSELNLPTASAEIPAEYVLTSLDQVLARQQREPGPVHINCMYREPLYPQLPLLDFNDYLQPLSRWMAGRHCYSQYEGYSALSTGLPNIALAIGTIPAFTNKKILVICGQLENRAMGVAVTEWAKRHQLPVFADSQSSVKGCIDTVNYYDQLLQLEPFQRLLQQAELIIQFGGRLISKRLNQWIGQSAADYWLVNPGEDRLDPNHRVNRRFCLSATQWLADRQISEAFSGDVDWLQEIVEQDKKMATWIQRYDNQLPSSSDSDLSEYRLMRQLGDYLPDDSALFLGNSMPVRLFDMYHKRHQKSLHIFTNRGASGIDGILASAAGIATGYAGQVSTLVIGDTSLLHDLNSLALANTTAGRLVIIVLNNDGGAIFNLLPVPTENGIREDFYQMPHGYGFADVCRMFGLNYRQPKNLVEFADCYRQAIAVDDAEKASLSGPATLIEVRVAPTETTDIISQLGQQLRELTTF